VRVKASYERKTLAAIVDEAAFGMLRISVAVILQPLRNNALIQGNIIYSV
jgi:hypothetical protein